MTISITAIYDLGNDKQYSDCHALLNMKKYGLFIATESTHDFQVFDMPFDAPFDPRNIIAGAKSKSTGYAPGTFHTIVRVLYSQCANKVELWEQFRTIAPAETQWYARMRMDLQ